MQPNAPPQVSKGRNPCETLLNGTDRPHEVGNLLTLNPHNPSRPGMFHCVEAVQGKAAPPPAVEAETLWLLVGSVKTQCTTIHSANSSC